jgi:hypothetical protein
MACSAAADAVIVEHRAGVISAGLDFYDSVADVDISR